MFGGLQLVIYGFLTKPSFSHEHNNDIQCLDQGCTRNRAASKTYRSTLSQLPNNRDMSLNWKAYGKQYWLRIKQSTIHLFRESMMYLLLQCFPGRWNRQIILKGGQ